MKRIFTFDMPEPAAYIPPRRGGTRCGHNDENFLKFLLLHQSKQSG
jgi:hypothetical protein